MTDHRLAVVLSFLLVCGIDAQYESFWQDGFRLGFSYDPLDLLGPAKWSTIGSSNIQRQPSNTQTTTNNNAQTGQEDDIYWGEWDYVGKMTAALDPSQAGLPLLLNFYENECGREAYPSPIELLPTSTCTDAQEMTLRQFNPYADCLHPNDNGYRQDDGTTQPFEITPYSLRYYYPRSDTVCLRPSVQLNQVLDSSGRNPEHFTLMWLEVHARSEHVLNGQRYDAELQMVHMGTSRTNELLIVSIMIQSDATQDNDEFQLYLLDGWQRKAAKERYGCRQKKQLLRERRHLRRGEEHPGQTPFSVHQSALHEYAQGMMKDNESTQKSHGQASETGHRRDLKVNCVTDIYGRGCEANGMGPRKRTFPYSLWPSIWYYSYTGSLTSPPCAGLVHWRIIDTPMSISRRQYKQMTSLLTQSLDDNCRSDSATSDEGENFRPLQNATLHGDNNAAMNINGKANDNPTKRQQDMNAVQNTGTAQTVEHCTSDNFQATVYSQGQQ